VFLAILETDSGTLRYSSAGHLPAVLADPQTGTTLITDAQSVPLAVHRDEPRPQATRRLLPGSTLMVFTDGLVERKNQPVDEGINRIAQVLSDTMDLPVDAVADMALRELAPASGYDDDVAIVAYRRPDVQFRIENDVTADQLVSIRHRLAAWLRAAAVPDTLVSDIVLAVNEACTNSIEHAYTPGEADRTAGRGAAGKSDRKHERAKIQVEAEIDADVHVRVIDRGSWKTPPADRRARGRGLLLIRAISDRVELDHGPSGTTVKMSFRLPPTQQVKQV
jgi:anti-sigma regulatory factor (Ser/Thr protein kinase)